jgi:3-oxoacyl-[acyl-carrier protein] reductase
VDTNLKGKAVFVTDGAHNFGRPLALAFAREGAHVFLSTQGDLDSPARAEAAVERCIVAHGRLDVVINNVLMAVAPHAFDAVPFELWKRKIEVELTGSFFLFKAVLPRMIAQQWGRIINFTGLAAFQGTDALAASTERGMVGMTRGIAREYGKYNITANCIGAGGIEGKETERGEEIAFLAVSLASEKAGYVTGQCLLANGGKYFL